MNYVKEMNADVFAEDPVCYSGALNYHGVNVDAIIKRMQLKIAEGCTFFLTQPIYTDADVERIALYQRACGYQTDLRDHAACQL